MGFPVTLEERTHFRLLAAHPPHMSIQQLTMKLSCRCQNLAPQSASHRMHGFHPLRLRRALLREFYTRPTMSDGDRHRLPHPNGPLSPTEPRSMLVLGCCLRLKRLSLRGNGRAAEAEPGLTPPTMLCGRCRGKAGRS